MIMHIKLVVNSFPVVSETFLFNLVVGLQAKGYQVSVCALSSSNHLHFYQTRLNEWSAEIDVMPYVVTGITKWFKLLFILLRNLDLVFFSRPEGIKKKLLRKIQEIYLLKGNPDIIHFAYSGIAVSLIDCISMLKLKGVKIVISCRGSAEKVRPIIEPKRKDELRLLFTLCDKVHCVSKDMMKNLQKYGLEESQSFINYPSVDVDYFNREKPYIIKQNQKIKIVTTGRLHFQKGYVYSLHAMKMLKDAGCDFEYKIIGDGPDKHMLQYIISEFGLEKEVILTGKVSSKEVKEILLESDIFILPSLYEGIANAALEAMALQIPLVTTRSGGMAEVITHRVNGILVERFNGIEIFNGIKELIENPELRKKVSDESRNVINEIFNTKNQIIKFDDFYKKVLLKVNK